MTLIPDSAAAVLADIFDRSDAAVRRDAARRYISKEDEYTASFFTIARLWLNSRVECFTVTPLVLRPTLERGLGADAAIVLTNNERHKLCVFEAKAPQAHRRRDAWDYVDPESGISHFSSQLERQARLGQRVAAWEMFYSFREFGEEQAYPERGSAVLRLKDALNGRPGGTSTSKWRDAALVNLLRTHGAGTVGDMVRRVCACEVGEELSEEQWRAILADHGGASHAIRVAYDDSKGAVDSYRSAPTPEEREQKLLAFVDEHS